MRDPTYDSSVLTGYATSLYALARSVVVGSTVTFAAVTAGAIYGAITAAEFFRVVSPHPSLFWAYATVPLAAVIGYRRGVAKAFALRLDAQRTLWFVEIERELRRMTVGDRPEGSGEILSGITAH